jgi:hypothetical protein
MSTLTNDPERQPLLLPEQQGVDNSRTAENVTATVPSDDPLSNDNVAKPDIEEKTHLWTALRYTIGVVGGVLILVFFIKGFIDAGDVDVCLLWLAPDYV